MKKILCTIVTAVVAIGMCITTLAGTWKPDAAGSGRWWYDNGDGTYAKDGWHWIDGNGDGTAECYYFDSEGWMLANTTTPDGYQVDGNGAWVQNGAVQTKQTGTQAGQTQNANTAVQNTANTYANNNGAPNAAVTWKSGTTGWGFDWSTGTGSAGLPKFKKADGSYAANEWIRTDSSGYDSYTYIFEDGYPRANTVTPDGRPVNQYGSWADAEGNTVYVRNGKTAGDYVGGGNGASNNSNVEWATPVSDERRDQLHGVYDEDEYIDEMVELINKEREKKNMEPVELDDELTEYAMMRAEEISELYSHNRPNGSRTKYSENIVNGGLTPKDAMQGFMNSAGHKSNILNGNARKVGIGIYFDGDMYYWVQVFK